MWHFYFLSRVGRPKQPDYQSGQTGPTAEVPTK
jgi:hypothetical protein